VSQVLVDIWPADQSMLTWVEPVRSILLRGIEASGARILHHRFHQFDPHGFAGFVLIAESHVSVHSWVEEGWMAVDIFSCGDMNSDAIVRHLQERLEPTRETVTSISRGDRDGRSP